MGLKSVLVALPQKVFRLVHCKSGCWDQYKQSDKEKGTELYAVKFPFGVMSSDNNAGVGT